MNGTTKLNKNSFILCEKMYQLKPTCKNISLKYIT